MKRCDQNGFVLAAMLVLLGLTALLLVDALTAAATSHASATRLLLQHKALEAAEAGLAVLTERVVSEATPIEASFPSEPGVDVMAQGRLALVDAMPLGFSAGRFRIDRIDLESRVTAPRRTRLVVRAGVARWSAKP